MIGLSVFSTALALVIYFRLVRTLGSVGVTSQAYLRVPIGVAIGMPLSFGLSRLLQGMLFGLTPTDGATFVGVAVLLAAVALLASWVPARRAARVDPMQALRYE